MKEESTQESAPQELMTVPGPVNIEILKNHFRTTYGLTDSQVELMLESSSRSLVEALENVSGMLGREKPEEQLATVFHGLKGLFLNMGEREWAAYAKALEQRLKEGGRCDTRKIAGELGDGVRNLLLYCSGK